MDRIGIRSLIATLSLGISFSCLGDNLEYWATFNTKKVLLSEDWKTASHLPLRSPELEFLQYGRFSQKFLRAVNERWTLGAHPAIEFKRNSGGDSWTNDYRIEIEATGKFQLEKGPNPGPRIREDSTPFGSGFDWVRLMRFRTQEPACRRFFRCSPRKRIACKQAPTRVNACASNAHSC